MRKEKSCGAFIVLDKKILLVTSFEDFWGVPKGHMEKGETEVETAIREVKEETNLDIKINEKYRYEVSYIVNKSIFKTVVFFEGVPTNKDIILQESELKSYKWASKNEVDNYNIRKETKKALKAYIKESSLLNS